MSNRILGVNREIEILVDLTGEIRLVDRWSEEAGWYLTANM